MAPGPSARGRPSRTLESLRTSGATAARRARTAAGAPVTSRVKAGGVTPGNRSSTPAVWSDALPGTSQPPPERRSLWCSENQPPAARSASQTAMTARRRRETAAASLPSRDSTSTRLPVATRSSVPPEPV